MATQRKETLSLRDQLKQAGKKVTGRVWNPAIPGDYMLGQLTGIDEEVGQFGSDMLRFVDPNGDEVAVWRRGTLKTQVSDLYRGKYLLIEYVGKEATPSTAKRGAKPDPMYRFGVYLLTQKQFDEARGENVGEVNGSEDWNAETENHEPEPEL